MIRNGRKGLPAEKVGEIVYHALTTPRPRVRYAVVPGNFFARWIPSLLPKRVLDRLIAKALRFI
jgi:hypothetical protein